MRKTARHAAKDQWREVAQLDEELGRLPWTDAWYPEAVELRVNWRLRVTDETLQRRYADQAVTLLDRLAIMNPTLSLYGLRTRAGVAAHRPELVLESLSSYARLAIGLVRAGLNTAESLRAEVQALQQLLDSVAGMPGLDAARIAEVRAEIAQLHPR